MVKPRFLRKHPLSLMGDASWWKQYTDGRDSLVLDMFGAIFICIDSRLEFGVRRRLTLDYLWGNQSKGL